MSLRVGVATVSASTFGFAPGYTARTTTVGGAISGYWRDRQPENGNAADQHDGLVGPWIDREQDIAFFYCLSFGKMHLVEIAAHPRPQFLPLERVQPANIDAQSMISRATGVTAVTVGGDTVNGGFL